MNNLNVAFIDEVDNLFNNLNVAFVDEVDNYLEPSISSASILVRSTLIFAGEHCQE